MADKGLTREFLAERDTRIFKMRQTGTPINEIARRLQMTPAAVNNAIRRQLEKLNREALLAYPEVLRLELERLDALQQAIWPLTQHRRVTLPDGTDITVEPDQKAVTTVLNIMDRRAKLLGMGAENIQIAVTTDEPVRAALAGNTQTTPTNTFDPESEARQLLELMGRTGVLPAHTVNELLGTTPELEEATIVPDPDPHPSVEVIHHPEPTHD